MVYLIDTSAAWELLRVPSTREVWEQEISAKTVGICDATRTEILYSARSSRHRDQMAERLDLSFGRIPVPKRAWAWIESTQYKLTQVGQHRSADVVDLLVCATAAHHDLTILHVDNDYRAVASVIPEVRQRDIRP